MRNPIASPYVRVTLVLVVVLVSDQVSKRIVSHAIVPGEQVGVLPGIELVHTRNHGVAFGLAAGDQGLVTALVLVALVALLAYFATHAHRPLVWLPTGLLLGGALGNLLDRLRTGSVVDFIQLPLGWPPFNLADASIVIGVLALLFVIESPRHGDYEPDGEPPPEARPVPAVECFEPRRPAEPGTHNRAVAGEFQIAYQDEHLLIVDKPAGLVVHPARGHREGTLAQLLEPLAAGGEDPERAGIVHRLDRDTSGLMVVARSPESHRRLQRALAERRITREYVALVHGRPPARTGTIEAPIGRDPHDRKRMSVDGASPREARTHFELERALGPYTLLRLRLDTGRTHQIRVHLQAIGHPVVGDPEYGRDNTKTLGLERQFLHAARLTFMHPFTGVPVDVDSPLPDDLQAALEQAQRLS